MVFVPMIGGTRVTLSVVGALLLGPLVAKIARGGEPREPADGLAISPAAILVPERDAPWGETLLDACREWAVVTAGHVIRLAPAMILAGFASGLAIQWLSPDTVSDWLGDDLAGVAIAAAVGVAINVPLLFEIPLVAALLMAGMGSAPAAALLFTAASAGPITFWGLAKVMPKRAVAAFGAGVWLLGIAGGGAALWLISLGVAPDLALRSDYAADPRAEAAMRDAPYSPALSLGGGARAVVNETAPRWRNRARRRRGRNALYGRHGAGGHLPYSRAAAAAHGQGPSRITWSAARRRRISTGTDGSTCSSCAAARRRAFST